MYAINFFNKKMYVYGYKSDVYKMVDFKQNKLNL